MQVDIPAKLWEMEHRLRLAAELTNELGGPGLGAAAHRARVERCVERHGCGPKQHIDNQIKALRSAQPPGSPGIGSPPRSA